MLNDKKYILKLDTKWLTVNRNGLLSHESCICRPQAKIKLVKMKCRDHPTVKNLVDQTSMADRSVFEKSFLKGAGNGRKSIEKDNPQQAAVAEPPYDS